MAITAGAVVIEVGLDVTKAKTQLEAFKTKMIASLGSVGTAFDALGVKATLMGNHLKASAAKGATANKELLSELKMVRGGLDGVTRASQRMATNSGKAFAPGPVTEYNKKLKTTGAVMQSVHGRLILLSAAIGAVFKKGITVGAVFENEMRKVKAVVGATEGELLDLTDTARHLAKTTTFMATEISRGMKILGQAGFSTAQIKRSIGDVLNLARAGSVSLERAAQVMIGVGKTFEISAENFSDVGDILVQTANNSATNIDLLGASFSFVGSTAVATGQKLKGISTLLGVLANRGLRGTKAGTALNEALLRLSQTKMISKMQGLGVAVVDLEGNMRPLEKIFLDLEAATNGLSNVEQAGEFIEIFGRRGARAGLLIARSANDVREMQATLDLFRGTANKTARDMEKDLLSKWRLLVSAVEELAIAMKDTLQPTLEALLGHFRGLATGMSNVLHIFPGVGRAVAGLAAVLAVLGATLVTLKFIIIPIFQAFKWGFVFFTKIGAVLSGAGTAFTGFAAALSVSTGFLAAMILVIAVAISDLMHWRVAVAEAEASANDYAKALKKISDAPALSAGQADSAIDQQIKEMQKENRSLEWIKADITKRMERAKKQEQMFLSRMLRANTTQEAATYKKLYEDREAYVRAAQKRLNGVIEKANFDQLARQAVAMKERERLMDNQTRKIEQAEKAHQKRMQRIKERGEERTRRQKFDAQVKADPMKAKQGAYDRRKTLTAAIAKEERNVVRLRILATKAVFEDADILDKIKESQAKIVALAERRAQAERDLANATKAQHAGKEKNRKAKIKEVADAEKAVTKAKKETTRAQAKADKAKARIAKSQLKFKESFEGVKGTIAMTGRGGSLSERLGATDPNVALGQKALKAQERQLAVLNQQLEVAKNILKKPTSGGYK